MKIISNTAVTAIIVLTGFFATKAHAQTFTWSTEPTTIENESEYKIEHVFDNERLFKLKSKYNDKVFNTDVLVDVFDPKDDFEKDDTNNLSPEQPAMGLNMLTLKNMFYISGKSYVQFFEEFNRSTKENEFLAQKVNIDTKSRTKIQLVTKMAGKNGSNPGNFYVAQSENKNFYVVLREPSYDKKINEKITLCLLDANFKLVKEIEYEFPFSSKQSKDQTLFVSNSGNVYLLKNIDMPKMKPYLSCYFWNSSTNAITEKSLKLENDYQINKFIGTFVNDEFLLQGFYSDGARFFQISYGESSPSVGILAAKFSASGELVYLSQNKTERYKNFYLKDILVENNKSWLIFDQMYKETKRLPSANPASPLDYRYEFIYETKGITLAMIDNSTGKMDWISNINNEERSTSNDNGDFFSSLYFLKNKQLSLIYNDTRDLNSGVVHVPHYTRVPVIQTFDEKGKMISGRDLNDSGAGGNKKNCFELDTSFKVPTLEKDNYIVRLKCGNSARYGYLKF